MIVRLRELYEHRELLRTFIARDLNARYKGSIFGIVWSLLNPLLNMVVYSVAFSVILHNPAPMTKTGAHAYAFFFMPSFLAWTFFQGSLAIGTMSILGASGLVKKVYFPREVLPLSAVFANLVNMAIAFAVLVPFSIFVIGLTLPGIAALLFVTVLFFLLAAGMTMVLAGLVVYFRDIEFLIGIVLSAWFFLTPIVWASGTLNDRSPILRHLLQLNFVIPFIESYRDVLYEIQVPPASRLLSCLIIGLVGFFGGYWIFIRLQRNIAEEL